MVIGTETVVWYLEGVTDEMLAQATDGKSSEPLLECCALAGPVGKVADALTNWLPYFLGKTLLCPGAFGRNADP